MLGSDAGSEGSLTRVLQVFLGPGPEVWGWKGSVKNDHVKSQYPTICKYDTFSDWMPLTQVVDAEGTNKDWKRKRSLRKRRIALKRKNMRKMCYLKNLTRKRKLLLRKMKRGNKRDGIRGSLARKLIKYCKLRKRRSMATKNGSQETYKRMMSRRKMPIVTNC